MMTQTELLDAVSAESFSHSIDRAAELLRSGRLVAFPTETVYGLGADALDAEAIQRVFAAKGRPSDNPMIVHVASIEALEQCGRLDDRARRLAAAFMPGPLTLVIPADDSIPSIARAGLPTVAVRMPDHPVAMALLERTGPLVAPSANLSGRPSPTTAQHVMADLAGRIAAVLDGGPCRIGIESTVVDVTSNPAIILRPGRIVRHDIERVLGEPVVLSDGAAHAPRSPGMKYRHYAPSVPVRLIVSEETPVIDSSMRRIVLTTEAHRERFPNEDVRILSEATLYAVLREADALGVDEVMVFYRPGELDAGLLNRVQKASGGGM